MKFVAEIETGYAPIVLRNDQVELVLDSLQHLHSELNGQRFTAPLAVAANYTQRRAEEVMQSISQQVREFQETKP